MTDLAVRDEATVADSVAYRPAVPALQGLVTGVGYELRGFPAGEHHGLPSRHLTFVVPLEATLDLSNRPDGGPCDLRMDTCVGGLHTSPVMIRHDGTQIGLHLSLTPAGCRAIFGMPAAELTATVVDVDQIWGALAGELTDRLRSAPSWQQRFAVLDEVLARVASNGASLREPRPEVQEAWRLLTERRTPSVAAVAREVGWSRRHLTHAFSAEFGLGPKQLDRVIRFEQANARLRRPERPTLAILAAECGYADQAHMARDWRDLAGCSPSEWLATEVLPFVQDGDGRPAGEWTHDGDHDHRGVHADA
jgi:AraC-like DNA-binding protein